MKRLILFLSVIATAHAATLLDRGLPTSGINDSVSANRSNVAWADGDVDIVYGDTFNLGLTGPYRIDTLRLWVVSSVSNLSDRWTTLTLYTGSGTTLTALSTVNTTSDPKVTITPTTYTGGIQYQNTGGDFINMWEIDFLLLNWTVDGATTYNFFLGSTGFSNNPHLLASNAGLSGSPQDDADGSMVYFDKNSPGIVPWDSNGDGWDKSSDINVQVFGEQVPEPSTFALLFSGLLGGLAVHRKRRSSRVS